MDTATCTGTGAAQSTLPVAAIIPRPQEDERSSGDNGGGDGAVAAAAAVIAPKKNFRPKKRRREKKKSTRKTKKDGGGDGAVAAAAAVIAPKTIFIPKNLDLTPKINFIPKKRRREKEKSTRKTKKARRYLNHYLKHRKDFERVSIIYLSARYKSFSFEGRYSFFKEDVDAAQNNAGAAGHNKLSSWPIKFVCLDQPPKRADSDIPPVGTYRSTFIIPPDGVSE